MSYSEEKFRDHIKAMLQKTQVDSDRSLTLDELKELALSMGMVDSEWETLLVKAEGSLDLAKKHLSVKNYLNAVEAAEEATSINPYIKDGNAVLSQAYYQLFVLEKNDAHLTKAGEFARRELLNDPMDATALHVLSAVENQQSESRYSSKLFKYLAIGGAIILLLFVGLTFCNQQRTISTVKDSLENGPSEQQSIDLFNLVEEKERLFKEAVNRRNDFLIAWLSAQNITAAVEIIENYEFGQLSKSESKLKKTMGEAQAKSVFSSEDRIQLEGLENRMAVEKKRWFEAIAQYNSFLTNSKTKGMNKIEYPN